MSGGNAGAGGWQDPLKAPKGPCQFDSATSIPPQLSPYVYIVVSGGISPQCLKMIGGSTIHFKGLGGGVILRGMVTEGMQNPISIGEPHDVDFTIDMPNGGGPFGYYIVGSGQDGPPGMTGPGSGAIYLLDILQ